MDTLNKCQVCEATTGDGMNLCVRHVEELEADLLQAGEWSETVWETIARQNVSKQQGERVTGSAENPLPLNMAASEVKGHLKAILVSWAILVHEEAEVTLSCDDTEEAIGQYLASHIDWLRKHDAAGDLYREVRDAIKRCSNVVDRAQDRMYTGRCGNVENGITCTEELWPKVGQPFIQCRTCGYTWDVKERWTGGLVAARDIEAPAATIAKVMNKAGNKITPARIYKWHERRQITASRIEAGKPLFTVGMVLDTWKIMQEKHAESVA